MLQIRLYIDLVTCGGPDPRLVKSNPIYPNPILQVGEFYMAQVSSFNRAEFPNMRSSDTSNRKMGCNFATKSVGRGRMDSHRQELLQFIRKLSEDYFVTSHPGNQRSDPGDAKGYGSGQRKINW